MKKYSSTIKKMTMALYLSMLLNGCGYHLRGTQSMPFNTAYLADTQSTFAVTLRRMLQATHVDVIDTLPQTQAAIYIDTLQQKKVVLSVNRDGRVRDYQLQLTFSWHVDAWKNGEKIGRWIPQETLYLQRNISFNDNALLAKESEESLLWQDLHADIQQQLIRRLSQAKLSE